MHQCLVQNKRLYHDGIDAFHYIYDGHIVNAAHEIVPVGEEVRLADCKSKGIILHQPDNTEDNMQARRSGMCEGPRNGRAQNLSIQGAAAWSFVALNGGHWSEETEVFTRQLAKARARQSFQRLHRAVRADLIAERSALLAHATFTSLAASLAKRVHIILQQRGWLPTGMQRPCHVSSLPPAEPQSFLEKHGFDLPTAQYNSPKPRPC